MQSTGSEQTMSEPTIGEIDIHLIHEGRHEQLWQALGSHWGPRGPPSASGPPRPWRSSCAATSTAGTAAATSLPVDSGVWRASSGSGPVELQVPHPRRRRRVARQGRPDGLTRGSRRHGIAHLRQPAHLDRRRLDAGAREEAAPTSSRCRSTRCTSAPGASAPELRRARRAAAAYVWRSASPTSSSCR